MDILEKKISQLLELMESNEISSEEITKACIENIEDMDSKTYHTLLKEQAIDKAREIDKKRKNKGKLASLSGIPVLLTDDISTKGILTTAGSKILEKYIPPFDATVMEKLMEEDSIVLGKLKINEFGLTPSNTVSETLDSKGAIFGLTTSMDSKKTSMKPTFGLVSRYGIIGGRSSFDQIVAVTNYVEDLALVLNCIAGYDKRDSTSINMEKVDYTKSLTADIKGIKIAVPSGIVNDDTDTIVSKLQNLGANVQEISLSTLEYVLPIYKILASAEFASISGRYDGISLGHRTEEFDHIDDLYKKSRSEGFGMEAKKQILFGNYVISSGQYDKYYKKAQKIRRLIKDELAKVTKDYGGILLPFGGDKDLDFAANVTGLPSISIPNCGQIIGSYLGEELLIKLAYALEKQGGGNNG